MGLSTRHLATGKLDSEFLLQEICSSEVFEGRNDLITMERAVLFKKKNYGKQTPDAVNANVSNGFEDVFCNLFSRLC